MTPDCLHIPWNGCYCICKSTVRRILCRVVKMGELQWVGHKYICNCVTFPVGLDSQRHQILNTQCYADTRATIHLRWKMYLLFCSPRHPWLDKMQATHKGLPTGQCSVHLSIDLSDTAKCSSTMSIFTFDQPLWHMAMITIKNNPQPNLHGNMLRLGGFHTPVNYLEAVLDSGLWSLIAFDPCLRIPLHVETAQDQEADHETIWIIQGGNAVDEGVDIGTSPVNQCCGADANRVDNAVVLNVLCICWNQWSTAEVHISWFQDKWPTQRRHLDSDDTTKITKFLDNENLFEVLFHMSQGMLTCSIVRTKDSWQNDWS